MCQKAGIQQPRHRAAKQTATSSHKPALQDVASSGALRG